ncbi:MAG: hypothetical protein J5829_01790 [Lachnospiraceae bacterium]|nr:hypothetical protein [Lachnospiraceae bacterium]
MNKKIVLIISIVVNVILALIFVVTAVAAVGELEFNYVEDDTITPDTIRSNLQRENYGVAASLSHPVRGGASIADEYMDYFMLGEYADLLFLKEIFEEAGNTQTVGNFEKRLDEIKNMKPEYSSIFDKIGWSEKNALQKVKK